MFAFMRENIIVRKNSYFCVISIIIVYKIITTQKYAFLFLRIIKFKYKYIILVIICILWERDQYLFWSILINWKFQLSIMFFFFRIVIVKCKQITNISFSYNNSFSMKFFLTETWFHINKLLLEEFMYKLRV